MRLALEVRGLTKRYHSGAGACRATAEAVRNVDLVVAPGEVVVISGAPGAGKTTLLLCAAGLLRADEGHVAWFGRAIGAGRRGNPSLPRHVAYADMAAALDAPAAATVGQLVLRSLRDRPRDPRLRRRIGEDALAAAGLAGHVARRIADLPASVRGRVALARALLARPALLLLDEPLRTATTTATASGGDDGGAEATARCVVALAQRGVAVVAAVGDAGDLGRLRCAARHACVAVRATALCHGRIAAAQSPLVRVAEAAPVDGPDPRGVRHPSGGRGRG